MAAPSIDRIAGALQRPSQPLWEKTFLCGSPGSTPPPACFNGSAYQPIPLAEDVDPARALSLLEQPENYPGVGVVAEPGRTYPAPHNANAAHLLGYVDQASAADVSGSDGAVTADETVGRAGLEEQYDAPPCGAPPGSWSLAIDPRGVVQTGGLAGHLVGPRRRPGHQHQRRWSRPPPSGPLASRHRRHPQGVARKSRLRVRSSSSTRRGPVSVVASASYPAYDPNVWTGGISTSGP